MGTGTVDLQEFLIRYRDIALAGIAEIIPDKEPKKYLYDLVMEYPNRGGKGFRPSLCIASCKAFGGELEKVKYSATALELFHNAFLVHDDVEDNSDFRRGKGTINRVNSNAIAVNLGDAMNVLSFTPLIKNEKILGRKLAWKIFEEIRDMVNETVEGQALELGWRKDNVCKLDDEDYFKMILKKTCWYTCIYPVRIGALIATNGKIDASQFNRFGYYMGISFQVQDDILNLVGDEKKYGKELKGDIVEGKRTLMLIHLLNHCTKSEFKKVEAYLENSDVPEKNEMAEWVYQLMLRYGSIDHARSIAKNMAGAALQEFYRIFSKVPASDDKQFLEKLIIYMINRDY
jgi:geranylgeranyl diphosphate synthase type II